ncbi:DUF1045 domain-containing protein [Xanthobacter sp. TB0139]|uniref:DUF1045 domain-containing protein n=1 Tax=Xanthobacter sp. TB0139 TaxID=3459178 RepID=UPI004039B475
MERAVSCAGGEDRQGEVGEKASTASCSASLSPSSGVPRYGLYFAPPEHSALWRFGSDWLGYDAQSGVETDAPGLPELSPQYAAQWRSWTEKPRLYGFHATLKAPFRLASDCDEVGLITALSSFAAGCQPFMLPPLELARLGRFCALVPSCPLAALDDLAWRTVRELDRFRAPLTAEDRVRRRAAHLAPRQRALLEAYGYPHVKEEFRFHMTLTGALEPDHAGQVEEVLRLAYARSGAAAPVPVTELALFRQPSPQARFRLIRRFAFAEGEGASAPGT